MAQRARIVDALVVALLSVLALGSVSLHVDRYTTLSPVDEMQHIDYLYRAPSPPAYGDKVGQDAMREQSCRGLDLPGFAKGTCSRSFTFDADAYQERGYSTGSMNAPVYYTLTKALAVPLGAVLGSDSLVTPGRLIGGLWLALGLVIAYLVAVRRGIGRAAAGSMLALLAASPAVIFPAATINPDSMGLLAGALVLLALTGWEQRGGKAWAATFLLVAVFVTAIKLTFILAVGAAALYLLARAVRRPGLGKKLRSGDTLLAVTSVALSLGTALGWLLVQSQRLQMDPDALPDLATRFLVPEFPWAGLMETSLQLLSPLASPWAVVGDPIQLAFVTGVPSLVLLGGVLGAGLFRAASASHSDLASATVVVAIVGCLGLTTVSYLTSQSYFPLPPRYASALVPLMALGGASLVRDRAGACALAGVAAVALVVSLLRISGIG
ncbi:MAG: glycosyltransferase family 39 protein [Nocardioides sp.]|nr:glycosyltransferase family 39 protein [Nocardioides sp.]